MYSQHACIVLLSLLQRTSSLRPVRGISLDITGTLITHKGSVVQHYVDAAVWAQLENPPSVDEMKPAFKAAYKERCVESPCFGGAEGISGRDWWRGTARRVTTVGTRSGAPPALAHAPGGSPGTPWTLRGPRRKKKKVKKKGYIARGGKINPDVI